MGEVWPERIDELPGDFFTPKDNETALKLAEHHLSAARQSLVWRQNLIQLTFFGIAYALWNTDGAPCLIILGFCGIGCGLVASFVGSWHDILANGNTALRYLEDVAVPTEGSSRFQQRFEGYKSRAMRLDKAVLALLILSGICAAVAHVVQRGTSPAPAALSSTQGASSAAATARRG